MRQATLVRTGTGAEQSPAGDSPAAAPRAKPHICFVAPYGWPVLSRDAKLGIVGGAEVQQSLLARIFRRAGYRVSMVTQDFGQPQWAEVDGVVVRKAFRQDRGLPIVRFFHPRLTSMWQAMREVDADIYYQRSAAHWTAVVAEFARRHGKRSVYAGAQDRDFHPGRQQIHFRRDRWLFEHGLALVDRVVVQNPRQQADVLRYYGRESTLIPSCYELPADSAPRHEELVLWVSTVHDYKRPELLIEIARRLPQRRFVMVGGSPGDDEGNAFFEKIRAAAAALPNLEFKGFLPLREVEPWFDRARVFVNTSAYEGVPNTFMQAWARAVPTVATVDIGAKLGGEPVYPIFETAEEGAAEIERLLTDELHWARSSARCREYFERSHSGAEALARYERLFADLVS